MLMDLRYFCVGRIPRFLFKAGGWPPSILFKGIVQNGVGTDHFICIGVCSNHNHSSQIFEIVVFPLSGNFMDEKTQLAKCLVENTDHVFLAELKYACAF